jgi:hypothetical protein
MTRKELTKAILLTATSKRCYQSDEFHPFCFNVKLYRVDLSFDTLFRRYQETNRVKAGDLDPKWIEKVRMLHEETNQESLYDVTVENLCRLYSDPHDPEDKEVELSNKVKVKVGYNFVGRTGGWLSITSLNGNPFVGCDAQEACDALSFQDLRRLWRLVMDTEKEVANRMRMVENEASFIFFDHMLGDAEEAHEEKLEKARLAVAEKALAAFEFVDSVKDTGRWNVDSDEVQPEARCVVYTEGPDDATSKKIPFVVRFKPGTAEIAEAYVSS